MLSTGYFFSATGAHWNLLKKRNVKNITIKKYNLIKKFVLYYVDTKPGFGKKPFIFEKKTQTHLGFFKGFFGEFFFSGFYGIFDFFSLYY